MSSIGDFAFSTSNRPPREANSKIVSDVSDLSEEQEHAECARGELSTCLGFGARLWPGVYSNGRVPQEATIGGFCEPWARLLLLCAAGDEPMGIHKRGPHGGLRSSGCSEGGQGLGGVDRSLFGGLGLLLLEGPVRAA